MADKTLTVTASLDGDNNLTYEGDGPEGVTAMDHLHLLMLAIMSMSKETVGQFPTDGMLLDAAHWAREAVGE